MYVRGSGVRRTVAPSQGSPASPTKRGYRSAVYPIRSCNLRHGVVHVCKPLQIALRAIKGVEPATATPGLSGLNGAWNPAACPAMLRSMQNHDRAFQIVNRVESGRLGSDSGLYPFIEILVREAVRSLTTHEGAQPRVPTAPDTSTIQASPGIAPRAMPHGPEKLAIGRPTNPRAGKARLAAARQGRLFE